MGQSIDSPVYAMNIIETKELCAGRNSTGIDYSFWIDLKILFQFYRTSLCVYHLSYKSSIDKIYSCRNSHETIRHKDKHLKTEHLIDCLGYFRNFIVQLGEYGQLIVQFITDNSGYEVFFVLLILWIKFVRNVEFI